MKLLKIINLENIPPEEGSAYRTRNAARAVVFDAEEKVAILHVTKHHYYKLPGGGVEEGESREDALRRECLEETGCEVEVGEYIGETVEYRRDFELCQYSYCYLARVVGTKGEPKMEQGEIDDGFALEWHSPTEATRLLAHGSVSDYQGGFVVERDRLFLQEGLRMINDRRKTHENSYFD